MGMRSGGMDPADVLAATAGALDALATAGGGRLVAASGGGFGRSHAAIAIAPARRIEELRMA